MAKEEMKSEIKGNDNNSTQIGVQNIYHVNPKTSSKESKSQNLELDDKAFELLKNAVEEKNNNRIIKLKDLDGSHIKCGNRRLLINSEDVGEREMAYWFASLNDLISNGLISDVGYKGEIFEVTKKGYECYDYITKKDIKKEPFKFEELHIEIIKLFKKNDDTLWERQLKLYFNDNFDKEIAFEELKEAGYIADGMVASANDGWCYNLNPSKKMEILKLLKARS